MASRPNVAKQQERMRKIRALAHTAPLASIEERFASIAMIALAQKPKPKKKAATRKAPAAHDRSERGGSNRTRRR
jgi:hypothetical protein